MTVEESLAERDVEIDLFGDLDDIRMLAFLCWPDETVRRSRMLTVGASLVGAIEANPVFAFVRNALMACSDGVPPKGTRDQIINRCSTDPAVRRSLLEFSINIYVHHLHYLRHDFSDPANFQIASSPEMLFWHCLRIPQLRSKAIRHCLSTISHVQNELSLSDNWLAEFAARGKSWESIDKDPNEALLGFPMVAGVILLLIASINKRNAMLKEQKKRNEGNDSLNYATEIVQAYASFRGTSTVARRLKGEEVWQRWRWFAPVWAGVLADANGTDIQWLRQPDLLTDRIFEVVRSEERRVRAFGYARWFAEFASPRMVDPSSDKKEHIPADEVIWPPDWLRSADSPPLLVLTPEIFKAVKNERRKSKENAERMQRERAQREKEARDQ